MIPEAFSVLIWILKAFCLFFAALICAAAVASVFQEKKIWANPKLPSLTPFGLLKVYGLNVFWMGLCAIGALLTPLYCLLTLNFDTRDFAHFQVERRVSKFLCQLFVGPVEVRGAENLPAEKPGSGVAPVLIANHDSQIDIAAVYHLNRQWRWIGKSSIIFVPGVGQIMWLSNHVFIDRVKTKNKSSTGARNLYVQSNNSVQSGVPMFIFPQGTRRLGERLPFKDGAFKIAKENNTQLIPISIEIPLTSWNSSYPFGKSNPVVLTVHKPIESKGREIEDLKKQCFDTIYIVLPDYNKES
jgi:lysophosphatidate acyltransferase